MLRLETQVAGSGKMFLQHYTWLLRCLKASTFTPHLKQCPQPQSLSCVVFFFSILFSYKIGWKMAALKIQSNIFIFFHLYRQNNRFQYISSSQNSICLFVFLFAFFNKAGSSSLCVLVHPGQSGVNMSQNPCLSLVLENNAERQVFCFIYAENV